MGAATVLEHNLVAGGWTDPQGRIRCEPAAHSVLQGCEREILLETAHFGRKVGMASCAIAVRNPEGEGRIFRVRLRPTGVWIDEMDDVCEPLLRAGARGVNALRDKPELRILALDLGHAETVRRALSLVPPELMQSVEDEPAAVVHMRATKYEAYLVEPDDHDPVVLTEVFLGGAANGLFAAGHEEGVGNRERKEVENG